VAIHGRRVGLGRAARELDRVLHLAVDRLVDRVELGGAGGAQLAEPAPERRDRAALRPVVDLGLRTVAADDRVALVVAHGAVGLGLDQGRPVAAPRAIGGGLHRLPHRKHIVAVDRDAGNAVGGGARRDLGVEGHRGKGSRRGVEVVLAHQHRGRALHAGEVDRLVERRMVDGAVAEERDRHAVGAAIPGADRCAHRGRDAGADQAVGAEQAGRAVVEMHRAAAPAAAAVALAVELGHQRARRHALGERVAVTAMRRGDPVAGPQMGADADRSRLLADIEVEEAGRLALAAGDLRRKLEAAQQHHLAIEPHQVGGGKARGRAGVGLAVAVRLRPHARRGRAAGGSPKLGCHVRNPG
jgi:hypothetical protein